MGTPICSSEASTTPCTDRKHRAHAQRAPGTCAYDPNARFVINGKNDAPTGRAALSYTFRQTTCLRNVSYNRGTAAGAFNGGGYTSSSGITYIKPETVNAYETGVKGRLFR